MTSILAHISILIGAIAMDADAANYDESKVPVYTLTDPLVMADGSKVADADAWRVKRRPEILKLFQDHVYGRGPGKPAGQEFDVVSENRSALDGKAIRKEIDVFFLGREKHAKMRMLIYIPKDAKGPAPAFIGLNFRGNHTIHKDPEISITESWVPNDKQIGYENNQPSERSRGSQASRWQVEKLISRGYALATIYCGDIDPDFHDGFKNGVHPLFYKEGQTSPASDEWGTVGAWAWGLSRGLDYLENEAEVDGKKVAVMGHSRLGKTSLWAGATDERFALVISNNSGCGGAALSKRQVGETVGRINSSFPHWFNGNFKKYSDNEAALPLDQHMLIALMAPRPVYVASAIEDRWADPRGEFLSAFHASPVYKLFGKDGMPAEEMPEENKPVISTISYHIRSGVHDVTAYDWDRFLDFADSYMR
ncbi:MAG: acetylxylan esterase [Planctomycetota bacterium]|nr:acetylxylan esterase [Planctomycetota bacterium]